MRTLIHPRLSVTLTPYHYTDLVTIQRNTEAGRDAYGGLLPPSWGAHLTTQECRYIMEPLFGSIDQQLLARMNTELQVGIVLIPGIVDVTPLDRVAAITDAAGNELSAAADIREVTFHTAYTKLVIQGAS